MGVVQVTAAVVNPGDENRRWEALFLVDTGATDCYVPGNRLREIGIKPVDKRVYELADGSEMTPQVGVAQVEFFGEAAGTTVVFDGDDTRPRLGMTSLRSVGIEIDPLTQRLKRLPAVRLKGLRSRLVG
jgi:clan AA aspartic protease